MFKPWKLYRITLPAVALLLALAASAPVAFMGTTHASAACTSEACGNSEDTSGCTSNKKSKAQHTSVLDADVIDNNIAFFKDFLFSESDQEDRTTDISPQSSTLILAIKALAATLLSTIV